MFTKNVNVCYNRVFLGLKCLYLKVWGLSLKLCLELVLVIRVWFKVGR